jgi:dihydrofolate synthase/folylpolyglutamate synthase
VAAVVAVAEALRRGRRAGGAVAAGLAGARVPGRGQPLRRAGREFLIDGGHNAQAGAALAATLATHFPGDRVTAVIGMASDKNHHAYLEALHPVVDRFLFTRSRNPRAADPRVLREANAGGAITTGVSRAILRALESPCDLIVVCGSFLVAGEALDVLAGL